MKRLMLLAAVLLVGCSCELSTRDHREPPPPLHPPLELPLGWGLAYNPSTTRWRWVWPEGYSSVTSYATRQEAIDGACEHLAFEKSEADWRIVVPARAQAGGEGT